MSGEDEVEASRAPLMTHLIELRGRLIRSLIAVFLAFVVCFAISGQMSGRPTITATRRG